MAERPQRSNKRSHTFLTTGSTGGTYGPGYIQLLTCVTVWVRYLKGRQISSAACQSRGIHCLLPDVLKVHANASHRNLVQVSVHGSPNHPSDDAKDAKNVHQMMLNVNVI